MVKKTAAAGRFQASLPTELVESLPIRTALSAKAFGRLIDRSTTAAAVRLDSAFSAWTYDRFHSISDGTPVGVVAYSYGALGSFNAANELGRPRILMQIDPGPAEEALVRDLYETPSYSEYSKPEIIPERKWESWAQEVELAHKIVVNSEWSSKLLVGEGVPPQKLTVLPLGFSRADIGTGPARLRRTPGPLRVLFLGQLIPRKGIQESLDAARMLETEDVLFTFAGPGGSDLPAGSFSGSNVEHLGAVQSDRAAELYLDHDVFLLPTHSDGFALTQVEAQAYGLPVIASRTCGSVVSGPETGLLLETVTSEEIARAISRFLENRTDLTGMRLASRENARRFSNERFGRQLTAIIAEEEKEWQN